MSSSPNRIYINFNEKIFQVIGYSIAKFYTGYSSLLELEVIQGDYIDLAFLKSGFEVNYYAAIELKYLKVSEMTPKWASKIAGNNQKFTVEEARMYMIQYKWQLALEQLKSYRQDSRLKQWDMEGRLKKWIIIFSTHRCLVNQEITDFGNARLELQKINWWF